jgi:hypothetical protein
MQRSAAERLDRMIGGEKGYRKELILTGPGQHLANARSHPLPKNLAGILLPNGKWRGTLATACARGTNAVAARLA